MKGLLSLGLLLGTTAAWTAPVTSTNDAAAVFDEGMFTLPDLQNPKDVYVLILVPSEGEVSRITLPPGVTGIRLARGALPTTAWTWRYTVSRNEPPRVTLVTPTAIEVAPSRLVDGRLSLEWQPVEGAKRYVISGVAKGTAPQDSPTGSKFEAACFASVCARGAVATKAIDIKPQSEVKWKVTAFDENEAVLARSEEGTIVASGSWAQAASRSGWKLQRSDTLSKETAQLPASVSYVSTQKEGASSRSTAYQSEFAVIYESPTSWGNFWPRASLEGKLTSTGEQKAGDQLRLRAGGYRLIAARDVGEGTELVANLKYETERKSGTKKGMVEIGLTPMYGWLARYWPGPPKKGLAMPSGNYRTLPAVQLLPVVSFGLELGKTMDTGTSSEKSETIVRFRTNARLDVELNSLADALGTQNVTAFVGGSYWHLPREDEVRNYRLGKAGLSIGLTDAVSFELAYSVGREAPAFKFSRSGTAGFGLKF